MKRLFLVPVLGLAALALSAPAQAQSSGWLDSSRPYYTAEQRQGYNDSRRAAYDNGYREGLKRGEREGRRRSNYSFRDDRAYQRADRGYHRSFGDIDRYRQVFRSGFAAGYNDGYGRYNRVVRGPDRRVPVRVLPRRGGGFLAPAFEAGVSEGYEKGVEDARKRRSFDVLRHKWYREGDRHYERRYGSREQYKDVYREGFKDGYERGYREGRYR